MLVGIGREALAPAGAGFDGTGRVVVKNASLVVTMDPAVGGGALGLLENADVMLDGDLRGKIVLPAQKAADLLGR